MRRPERIREQVDRLVGYLMEVGLSDDQNFAIRRGLVGGRVEITFPQADHVSIAMKDRDYREIYQHMARERAFNVKLLDGALIQMMYVFAGEIVERHRLAFFPSPQLEKFQNSPEVYLQDVIFADVVSRAVVPFPLRFDHDSRDGAHREVHHPRSHLTLGQYRNCRIPVSAPLTPFWFINFILRNFYHTAFLNYADRLPKCRDSFDESIAIAERSVVYLQVPVGAG